MAGSHLQGLETSVGGVHCQSALARPGGGRGEGGTQRRDGPGKAVQHRTRCTKLEDYSSSLLNEYDPATRTKFPRSTRPHHLLTVAARKGDAAPGMQRDNWYASVICDDWDESVRDHVDGLMARK